MYGPLWIMISLFTSIPIFGNFSQFMKAYRADDLENYIPDLSNIWMLLSCLLLYFFLVPYILHNIFKFGSGYGSIDSRYFFIASIYGYSFAPFVPGIMVNAFPNEMIKWVALLCPTVCS